MPSLGLKAEVEDRGHGSTVRQAHRRLTRHDMVRPVHYDKGIAARDYALRLLTIRPRSVREMRDRLARRGYEKREIEDTVVELMRLGLLNDRKFAAQWVESRISLRPMGSSRLRAELVSKGVDRRIIDQTLSQYEAEQDEKLAALALAQKKMKTLARLKPEIARRRLAGFLTRRGFQVSVINEVLKKINLLEVET